MGADEFRRRCPGTLTSVGFIVLRATSLYAMPRLGGPTTAGSPRCCPSSTAKISAVAPVSGDDARAGPAPARGIRVCTPAVRTCDHQICLHDAAHGLAVLR